MHRHRHRSIPKQMNYHSKSLLALGPSHRDNEGYRQQTAASPGADAPTLLLASVSHAPQYALFQDHCNYLCICEKVPRVENENPMQVSLALRKIVLASFAPSDTHIHPLKPLIVLGSKQTNSPRKIFRNTGNSHSSNSLLFEPVRIQADTFKDMANYIYIRRTC